jgi:hypothetical protein
MGEIFRSAFTEADLIGSATVSVVAGSIIKLGEYKVQAGELLTIGYGEQSGQDNAVGRFYLVLKNASSTVLNGKVRLSAYSPQNRPLVILGEWRTETLASGASDRSLMTPLPENNYWLSEDKKLVLEFISDTTDTVSKANSDILMDITVEAV